MFKDFKEFQQFMIFCTPMAVTYNAKDNWENQDRQSKRRLQVVTHDKSVQLYVLQKLTSTAITESIEDHKLSMNSAERGTIGFLDATDMTQTTQENQLCVNVKSDSGIETY